MKSLYEHIDDLYESGKALVESVEEDLKVIRDNGAEKYAIEYIKYQRQEDMLRDQGKLTPELEKTFKEKRQELVDKSKTYRDEQAKYFRDTIDYLNRHLKPYNIPKEPTRDSSNDEYVDEMNGLKVNSWFIDGDAAIKVMSINKTTGEVVGMDEGNRLHKYDIKNFKELSPEDYDRLD